MALSGTVLSGPKWCKTWFGRRKLVGDLFARKARITLRSLSADGRRQLRDVSRRPYVKQEVLVSRPEVAFGDGK